ncbi:bromodomain-containing protein 4 isoform X2 [Cylas formicarius]|nr:bromodomain-containing protein 4 isoform X2 [Cylas formicarius]
MVSMVLAADQHRLKRNGRTGLENIAHHVRPNYNIERRLLTGLQHYSPPQYFPDLPRSYRKGRPRSLSTPPYAVQMEPLIHYSQRDPYYDTNILSSNTDYGENEKEDPIDRGGKGGTIYIPNKPFIKVVEKPIYIKEPEPIIEIIIKESNVTLPPPPTEPPLPIPKKKKEEVQVFYVKYKKNPGGYGKDAVIYDKPIPAISPVIPEEEEEPEPEEEWKESKPGYDHYNEIPQPRPPSTTLRTIIKPDSETYHSPGGDIKVTFGKEGFDYSKRSSKPDDYPGQRPENHSGQQPRALQLTSFSDVYFRRPEPTYQNANQFASEPRQAQPYRPFNNPPPPLSGGHYSAPPPPFFPQPKHPFQSPTNVKTFNSPPYKSSFPTFSHTISHPPPPQFQSHRQNFSQHSKQHIHFGEVPVPAQRKPVPYTPFENIRPSQPSPVLPSSHHFGNYQSDIKLARPTTNYPSAQQLPQIKQNIQLNTESRYPPQQQSPAVQSQHNEHRFKSVSDHRPDVTHFKNQQSDTEFHKQISPDQIRQLQQQHGQNHYQLEQSRISNQGANIETIRNALPPGGELIHSIPKYEQHLLVNPSPGTPQALPLVSQRQQSANSFIRNKPQDDSNQSNTRSNAIRQNGFNQPGISGTDNISPVRQPVSYNSTPRIYISTTESTTTTKEPEKTSTKDPKILEAQLPDEVPEELRQQLLSSGILNNADISILDYDKVGDIPLSALPPEQLANFYSAGGAQQLASAGSESVYRLSQPDSEKNVKNGELEAEASETNEVRTKPDGKQPDSETSRTDTYIPEAFLSDNTKEVDPLLNDSSYNRYLPLRISGSQFPLDVANLKGREISDVVVLAPVTDDLSASDKSIEIKSENYLDLIENSHLRKLLENTTSENYKTYLQSEKNTTPSKQSVILLVTRAGATSKEKEIFMFDVATGTANKLSGELSSAFVEVAEANSPNEDPTATTAETETLSANLEHSKRTDTKTSTPE